MREATEVIKVATRRYSTLFARDGTTPLPQWRGEPRELTKAIAEAEATEAAKRLRSDRALGPDDVAGELIKRGGEETHEELAKTCSGMLERREKAAELTEGRLLTMNKPGKPRVVEDARPLALLSITRKVLSSVVLRRVSDKADKLVSLSLLPLLRYLAFLRIAAETHLDHDLIVEFTLDLFASHLELISC